MSEIAIYNMEDKGDPLGEDPRPENPVATLDDSGEFSAVEPFGEVLEQYSDGVEILVPVGPGEDSVVEIKPGDTGYLRAVALNLQSPFYVFDERIEELERPEGLLEQVEESEESEEPEQEDSARETAEKAARGIMKARQYISDPSEAPEGVQVEEGERGGLYFEPEGQEGSEEGEQGGAAQEGGSSVGVEDIDPEKVEEGMSVDRPGDYELEGGAGTEASGMARRLRPGSVAFSYPEEYDDLPGEYSDPYGLDEVQEATEVTDDPRFYVDLLARYASEGEMPEVTEYLFGELESMGYSGEAIVVDLYGGDEGVDPEEAEEVGGEEVGSEEVEEGGAEEEPETLEPADYGAGGVVDSLSGVGDVGIGSGGSFAPTGPDAGFQDVWEEASTEELEGYMEWVEESGEGGGEVDIVRSMLYYRDDSDVSFDDIAEVGLDASVVREYGEAGAESYAQNHLSHMEDAFENMDPALGSQLMGAVGDVEMVEAGREFQGQAHPSGDIDYDIGATFQTVPHEIGHQLHHFFGVASDGTDNSGRSRGSWSFGLTPDQSGDDEFRNEVRDTWEQVKEGERTQLKELQGMNGAEHLAVSFQEWSNDPESLVNSHPELYAFWEEYAGGADRIEDYENLQEGDVALSWDDSGRMVEVVSTGEEGMEYSVGEGEVDTASWEEVVDSFVGGVRR